RLHARQHARDAAHVDVADEAAARGALDQELLHAARRDDRDARLLRRDVDQDLVAHLRRSRWISMRSRSCALSQRGSPITPEKLPRSSLTKTAARPWIA